MQSTSSPVTSPAVPAAVRPYMKLNEAADYLRISARKMRKLVAARALRVARIGRRLVFSRAELDRYAELQMALCA